MTTFTAHTPTRATTRAAAATPALSFAPWNLLAELRRRQPTLAVAAQLFLLGALPCLIAMMVDPRLVNDVSVWIKPAKFFVSLALLCATLGWYFGYLPEAAQRTRSGRFVIMAPVVAGGLEMLWLVWAAVVGVPAHFNRDSVAWGMAYNVAGAGATVLLAAMLVQGWMIGRDRETSLPPALRRAFVLAAVLSFVLTLVTAITLSSGAGHWVGGTPSDAGGLPLLGWSRSGGDLRVAHFFALHIHQALPLAAALIVASGLRRSMLAVHVSAAAMVGATLFVFVQALSGRPFIG